MQGISSDILTKLRKTLLGMSFFDSDKKLRVLFVDARIYLWKDSLPEADSRQDRVNRVINFLWHVTNIKEENGLILFLYVLQGHLYEPNLIYHELDFCIKALKSHFHPPECNPRRLFTTNLFVSDECRKPEKLKARQSTLVGTDDMLVVCTEPSPYIAKGSSLYGLSLASAIVPLSVQWQYTFQDKLALSEFPIYVKTHDLVIATSRGACPNWVIALRGKTGELVWQKSFIQDISRPYLTPYGLVILVHGDEDNRLVVFAPETGMIEHERPISHGHPIDNSVFGNSIYVSSAEGAIYGYDLVSDRDICFALPDGSHPAYPPVIVEDKLFVTTYDGYLYTFDLQGGYYSPSLKFDRISTWPLLWKNTLFISSYVERYPNQPLYCQLHAIDLKGHGLVWERPFSSGKKFFYAPQIVHDNMLLCCCCDGDVYAINAYTGQPCWQQPYHMREKNIYTQPIVADGIIYIADRNGRVDALVSEPVSRRYK